MPGWSYGGSYMGEGALAFIWDDLQGVQEFCGVFANDATSLAYRAAACAIVFPSQVQKQNITVGVETKVTYLHGNLLCQRTDDTRLKQTVT
jgi:hypothetical protein